MPSTQITKIEIYTFIAVLVFKLSSRKVFLQTKKDNRNFLKIFKFLPWLFGHVEKTA